MSYAVRYINSTGETCTISRNPPLSTKVSKRRSTSSIRDFGAREAYWEGLIPLDTELLSGETFTIDGETYLVQSVVNDPASGEIFWYAVKTNTILCHQRLEKKADKNRNIKLSWKCKNTSVPAFGEIVTVEMRNRDPGILQGTRYFFQVSKLKGVLILDRVLFNDNAYRVDAVNDIGMPGVVRIQVSEDNRA